MSWFEHFETRKVTLPSSPAITLHARIGGRADAPPLLLLHGFPQTHVMWHRVAQKLLNHYRLVIPDLRGYGDSTLPADEPQHAQASKRAMAADMAALMRALGHDTFCVAGHDRGGRVAHRLAVDHPQAVRKLCVLDIAPTLDMYGAQWRPGLTVNTPVDDPYFSFARAYYHWFHLIQPAPLPETMIDAAPRPYLHAKLGGWGAGGTRHIEPEALAEYERCFCRPESIHTACEDYRASAGIDLEHDRESRAKGERIACDTLVLWGANGLVGKMFDPLALWQAQCAATVTGQAIACGHFIPEEQPDATATALRAFFG